MKRRSGRPALPKQFRKLAVCLTISPDALRSGRRTAAQAGKSLSRLVEEFLLKP